MTTPSDDRAEIVRKCYLFADADPGSIARLAASSVPEKLPKNRQVFSVGDEVDGLHILLDGLIRIWINDAEGRELTLTLIEPGDAFGEIGLLDGALRSANATAIEPSELLIVKRTTFDTVLENDPALARHLIVLLCERLRRNTEDLHGFAFQDMRVRLCRKLHDLAMAHAEIDGHHARFTRRFSQTELASMLGATREAVNKRLAALTFDGIVSIENGRIEILDLEALLPGPED